MLRRALIFSCSRLAYYDIDRRRTFLSLLDVKGNPVTFIEAFKTACVDR
jgi:hypothetical protein